MTERLTINEVLRFMHHDFMNQLQLVKMNLDLEETAAANRSIQKIVEECQNFFNINELKLPKVTEWLHTVNWRYPSIHTSVTSHVDVGAPIEWDVPLYNYLEQTLNHIYKTVDPLTEQLLTIVIFCTEHQFEISFELNGRWSEEIPMPNAIQAPFELVEEHFSKTKWQYCIHVSKEGLKQCLLTT